MTRGSSKTIALWPGGHRTLFCVKANDDAGANEDRHRRRGMQWKCLRMAAGSVHGHAFDRHRLRHGRGVGGRASTRRLRDCPGLFVNHGAVALHVREHSTLVSAIRDRNEIVRWVGTVGKLNVDGSLEQIEDYFGTAHVYTGVKGMSNVVRGIFDMANVEVRCDARISVFKPLIGGGWELLDCKGASVGEF